MSSRDFGGNAIYGDNMPSNNFNDNHNEYQGQSPIRINSGVDPSFFERSLIPTTIKKILNEKAPAPDQSFCIDGKPVHQVSIIGIITDINPQSTHTLFDIDDQNVTIKCKLWSSDNDDIKELIEEKLKENDLVKVIGKVDTFKDKRTINIHHIEKITNHNIIALHGLEIILSHELNELIVNQHLPTQKKQYQQWIDRAKNEESQRNKAYQEYKQSQQNQSPQRGQGFGGNYNHNHNHNHNRNQPQSGGFARNSNSNQSPNRFVSHSNNNHNHNNGNNNNIAKGDEAQLGEWEKRVLGWMRGNLRIDDQIGKSRQIIKSGVRCFSEQIFNKALDNLCKTGLIVDTIGDNYALTG